MTTIHPFYGTLALALALNLAGVRPAAAVAAAGVASPAPVAATTLAYQHCSWNRPGVNPFMGDVVAAVDRYRDIPVEVRDHLKARMTKREYDDLVSIRRDAITGRGGYDYASGIADMHFGTNQVCRTVTRASWTPQMEERGLVYCESGHCILVPTVCRNVSRIGRKGVGSEVAEGLPPFLPPGAGRPVADDPAGAIEPLGAPPPLALDAFPASAAGLPKEGGPIGQGPTLGYGALLGPAAGGFVLASGGGGGGGGGVGAGAGAGSTGDRTGTGADAAAAGGATGTTERGPASAPASAAAVVSVVPEPSTWALLIGGGALLALRHRSGRRPAVAPTGTFPAQG